MATRIKLRRRVLARVARYGGGFGLAGIILGAGSLSWLPLVSVVGLALLAFYAATQLRFGRRPRT